MGVQTMSSHSHADDGRRGLPRQGSVYGLTLTEVETQLGEPLRTMNLDDLLRTVLPAAPAAAAGQPPAAKKTVDEVWRDIQSAGGGGRQPSMGEMTLEDFLSRAGVAVDAAPHWMHQYPPQQQYALPRPLPLGAAAPGPALDAAYRGDRAGVFLSHSLSQLAGRKRSAAAAVAEDGVVERTVERRQKRMIKNRESAARSRARKQAYTNELENKIARLEEENERLRKLKSSFLVDSGLQKLSLSLSLKLKMLEPLEPPPEQDERLPLPQPERKQQQHHHHHLRRTNSASF